MKWELVVTDPNAGKTGRVRIEAPDQATAERIASEKGWVVSSARLFEAGAAPVVPPPPAPPPDAADEEPSPTATEAPGFTEASSESAPPTDPQEDRPAPMVMPLEKERTSRATGASLPYPPAPAAKRETPAAPAKASTAAAAAVAAPTPPGRFLPCTVCLVFWLAGAGLIAWGIWHVLYYFGFSGRDAFFEPGHPEAATANRLAEMKALMRALVGGVYLVGGLLAAILGTLIARPSRH